MQILKGSNNFRFPDEQFYIDLCSGNILDSSALDVLEPLDITLDQIRDAIRRVFKRISLPYSPHGSAAVRKGQVSRLLTESKLREYTTRGKTKRDAIVADDTTFGTSRASASVNM